MDNFLNNLRWAGKSELTVKQYKNTLMRFAEWLSGDPHPTPRTPQGSRGKGSDIFTQNFKISNTSNIQRSPNDTQHSPNEGLTGIKQDTVVLSDAIEYSSEVTPYRVRDDVSSTYTTEYSIEALRGITELDVADFKHWAIQQYQPGTVKVMLTQLKVFYRWLSEAGQIPDNPVTSVKTVTVVKQAPKWLTRNEQNLLIRAVRKHGNLRELTLITLMLHTGLRVQEVADLRLADIEICERKGKVTVRNGKHSRRREVPLNIDTRQLLKRYLQDNPDLEYLFPNKTGGRITTRSLQSIIEKYKKLTNIQHLNAHSLRHTFCHELVSRKIPLDVVARLAGHVKNDGTPNIQQTLTYTQPGEDDLQRAVDELSWQ
ncbi:integrase family protein [Desulfofarcimen acetoxidans DSM 771]|uniref:Integrase family protein n=1 Tax=Desulfofarcimen acetoxidans (strain ATCC 49208 / DSM 771 / KCTC 5769 / VKM B-1644 / 5575) TaxID=485916 RepID=C8VXN8_DESAS|nr:tyrosine-type recombinase/integrase [Desulfofarcimen acetoxidans]ACV62694.1 integrase family protein [Desulfofarcimen acetoxidans DSM 771]